MKQPRRPDRQLSNLVGHGTTTQTELRNRLERMGQTNVMRRMTAGRDLYRVVRDRAG